MKRAALILVLIASLAGSACSRSASLNPPPAQPAQTLTVIHGTAVETPGTTQPAAGATPPALSSASPVKITETFDEPDDAWSPLKIVTSQAAGHDPLVKTALENGRLRVSIQDKETYVYQFLKTPVQGSASISATYEYRTLQSSGVALVCDADPNFTAWYEIRLLGAESKVDFYQYDQKLKADGKNPYVLLGSAILAAREFSSAGVDTVRLSCSDRKLSLDLNQGARVITQTVSADLKGGLGGIGVMSYNLLPVNIDFKTVSLQGQ